MSTEAGTPLRHPTLYAEEGTAALPGAPALRATRSSGGHLGFPPQRFGCQLSGDTGDKLEDVLLTGRGRLHAKATVFMHPKPTPKTPFTVVEVALDDGPMVRGLLAADAPGPLDRGAVLYTCLEAVPGEAGEPLRDLRFTTRAPEAR